MCRSPFAARSPSLLGLWAELAERGAHLLLPPLAPNRQRHLRPGRRARHLIAEGVRVADFDTVQSGDNVALPDARAVGGAAGLHLTDDHAFRLPDAEARGRLRVQLLHDDAELPASHLARTLQLLHHAAGHVRGDGEAYAYAAARRREYLRVDADELGAHVDERAAGVALIDRGVRLEEVLEAAVAQPRLPALGADDSFGHGLPDAERVADGEHHVADPHAVGVAEREQRQIARVNFQQG